MLPNIEKKTLWFYPEKSNLATKMSFVSSYWLSKKDFIKTFSKLSQFLRTEKSKSDAFKGFFSTKTSTVYVILFIKVIFSFLKAFSSIIFAFKNGGPMKSF